MYRSMAADIAALKITRRCSLDLAKFGNTVAATFLTFSQLLNWETIVAKIASMEQKYFDLIPLKSVLPSRTQYVHAQQCS